MKSVAGVFRDRDDAVRGIGRLLAIGVENSRISFLAPEHPDAQFGAVPVVEGEAPGMGPALGAVVGGASGAALGAAAASLLIPGIGPIAAIGFAAAALIAGAGGAVAGAALGDGMEGRLDEGVPIDELFLYEEALRQGRSVVLAIVPAELADSARAELLDAGAESIDAAREMWWSGLRDTEEREYSAAGGDFSRDEPYYRRGFESALRADLRGGSYDQALDRLRIDHPDCYGQECFRRGYERGGSYGRRMRSGGRTEGGGISGDS